MKKKLETVKKLNQKQLKKKAKIGPIINKERLALKGTFVSFKANFKPSAKGCNKPKNPTTFGPRRRWTEAITFRSNNVNKAVDNKIKIEITQKDQITASDNFRLKKKSKFKKSNIFS